MLGLSASKILLLALIIGAVVVGSRVLRRVAHHRNERKEAEPAATPAQDDGAVDLQACRVCGTFHSPAKATACGRTGCPYAA